MKKEFFVRAEVHAPNEQYLTGATAAIWITVTDSDGEGMFNIQPAYSELTGLTAFHIVAEGGEGFAAALKCPELVDLLALANDELWTIEQFADALEDFDFISDN